MKKLLLALVIPCTLSTTLKAQFTTYPKVNITSNAVTFSYNGLSYDAAYDNFPSVSIGGDIPGGSYYYSVGYDYVTTGSSTLTFTSQMTAIAPSIPQWGLGGYTEINGTVVLDEPTFVTLQFDLTGAAIPPASTGTDRIWIRGTFSELVIWEPGTTDTVLFVPGTYNITFRINSGAPGGTFANYNTQGIATFTFSPTSVPEPSAYGIAYSLLAAGIIIRKICRTRRCS